MTAAASSSNWSRPAPPPTTDRAADRDLEPVPDLPADLAVDPRWLIAGAAVLGAVLVVAIARRLVRTAIAVILIGLVAGGLYLARAGGYVSW